MRVDELVDDLKERFRKASTRESYVLWIDVFGIPVGMSSLA